MLLTNGCIYRPCIPECGDKLSWHKPFNVNCSCMCLLIKRSSYPEILTSSLQWSDQAALVSARSASWPVPEWPEVNIIGKVVKQPFWGFTYVLLSAIEELQNCKTFLS